MSGRRLGRLLGSFLMLAAVFSVALVAVEAQPGKAKTDDIIWNMPAPR